MKKHDWLTFACAARYCAIWFDWAGSCFSGCPKLNLMAGDLLTYCCHLLASVTSCCRTYVAILPSFCRICFLAVEKRSAEQFQPPPLVYSNQTSPVVFTVLRLLVYLATYIPTYLYACSLPWTPQLHGNQTHLWFRMTEVWAGVMTSDWWLVIWYWGSMLLPDLTNPWLCKNKEFTRLKVICTKRS